MGQGEKFVAGVTALLESACLLQGRYQVPKISLCEKSHVWTQNGATTWQEEVASGRRHSGSAFVSFSWRRPCSVPICSSLPSYWLASPPLFPSPPRRACASGLVTAVFPVGQRSAARAPHWDLKTVTFMLKKKNCFIMILCKKYILHH